MIETIHYLSERHDEFRRHLDIARMLESRVNEAVQNQDVKIEVRHVNTIKSGILIHLYNIVEAVTTRTLDEVGRVVVSAKPAEWTNVVLREWVRAEVWSGEERIGEAALNRLIQITWTLASGQSLSAFKVKGEPGSWNDKGIQKVAKRLGCELKLSRAVQRAAYEKAYRDDRTALEYLAYRRNEIAHGLSTFEDGAHDLTLDELENLSKRVIPYLREVAECYRTFLDERLYLAVQEVAS
jgi:hypothetical protein